VKKLKGKIMKRLKGEGLIRVFVFLLFHLFTFSPLTARPLLKDLNIQVVLSRNGDARITETRQMTIDSEGTECYIVIGNLNGSDISDLTVSDETGRAFTNTGAWDIDRSRDWKEGKCGIVSKHNGYELCWGLGESGERTYTTSYTVTNLVKGYDDADGFNYMFVSKDMDPKPEFARITIRREDGQSFTDDDTNIWAFRFDGDIEFEDGNIVAQTDNALEDKQAVIVMVEVEKGIFDPAKTVDGSFEDVKERAFNGSDYNDGESIDWWVLLLVFACPLIFIIWGLVSGYRLMRERRRVKKDLSWFRGIPFGGNLQKANEMMNSLRFSSAKYDNLLNAVVMRLISIGAISVETIPDKRGRPQQQLVINELNAESQRQQGIVRKVHAILLEASGDDRILQPKELKKWVRRNAYHLEGFVASLKKTAKLKEVMAQREQMRELYGLRMFLKDFTLAHERHAFEVSLWSEYLVWASFFGIAKQVRSDMKKLNADFTIINKQLTAMNDDKIVPAISAALLSSTHRADHVIQSRNSGSGGSASSSGGGGYSGGGSGGGAR
jgi:uncharacterized membrane protein YgcG